MQFLVLSRELSDRLADSTIDETFLVERQCLPKSISRMDAAGFSVFASQLSRSGRSVGFLDGYVFGPPLLHAYRSQWSAIDFAALTDKASEMSGVYTALYCDADRFRIVTDPLGQYSLFYWQAGNDFIVANNLYVVRGLLQKIGISTTPNPINFALNIAHMTGFGNVSPIDPIKLLPPRHSFHFRDGLHLHETVSRKDLLHRPGTYLEQVGHTADRITSHCRSIADLASEGAYVVSDLSGGVDSRINLAGFLNAGAQPHIRFFCSDNGDPSNPTSDRIASDNLVHMFNLRTGGAIWDAKNSTSSYTTAAKVLAGTHRYFGLLPVVFEDYGDLYIQDYARVGGYCGEHTRAFGPSYDELPDSAASAANSFDAYYGERGRLLLTNDGRQAVRKAFLDYFTDLLPEIDDPKLINVVAYVENRSRYHFGLRSQIGNMAELSFSPLVEPTILALQRHLPYLAIEKNRIARDLMIAMAGPVVADAPRAHGRWGDATFANPGEYKAYRKWAETMAIKGAPISPQTSYSFLRIEDQANLIDTEFDRRFADYSRYPSDIVKKDRNFAVYAEMIRYGVELIPANDTIWTIVDRNHLLQTVDGPPPQSEAERLTIRRLVSSLMFYSGASGASPLRATSNLNDLRTKQEQAAATAPDDHSLGATAE